MTHKWPPPLERLAELSAKATPGPWIRRWASLDVHHMRGDDALQAQRDIDFAVTACAYVRDILAHRSLPMKTDATLRAIAMESWGKYDVPLAPDVIIDLLDRIQAAEGELMVLRPVYESVRDQPGNSEMAAEPLRRTGRAAK